jgi:hypothetical protein
MDLVVGNGHAGAHCHPPSWGQAILIAVRGYWVNRHRQLHDETDRASERF